MMHGKVIWKPGIIEIAKTSNDIDPGPHKWTYSCPYEPSAAKANMLKHV